MGFGIDKLGRFTDGPEFKVEADRVKAYAEATNDPITAHRSGEVAPPVFAVVPTWDTMITAMAGVVPPEVVAMVVHGEQDMYFHAPIRPGMALRTTAAPVGVNVKPNGTSVIAKTMSYDQDGTLLVEQYMTSFFRGVSEGESAGEEAPPHKLEDAVKQREPDAVVTQHLDDDQTFRYAEASGDNMPMHLDDDFAKSVGLPGIIIHGLCTMAFTSWAVITTVGGGDPARLARLAVRFSRPVLPGQEITTRLWTVGARDGATVYGFETTNPDGDLVVKDGLAEVSPS
jgi:acyl dehydratase